ncbi:MULTISPECIES: ApeI family dehydratase [Francisella]|uniref:(3R)-hydroxymyristoyl-[ACP] dehydratase n=1 Tax=Francisella salina TaxID=573569 RepID=A0ABM5M8R8_FRAST|nr:MULTISPECIES: hydroxymyristoyl-ACP dehydratase [Francisella]AEI35607.1 (3R)-hydroxymyristoyl-[ACP] dehydratase [Francisella salina]
MNKHLKINNIQNIDDCCVLVSAQVLHECDFFKGHFQEQAILPGIAQVDFVINLASQIFDINKLSFGNIPQVKFKKVILPNDDIEIKITNNNNTITFEISVNNQVASQGKIKYE